MQRRPRIAFTVIVGTEDWNAQFGGWRCSALRIPSAQLSSLYVAGRRADSDSYKVDYENEIIRWIGATPPDRALCSMTLHENLSTQELTLFWKKLAIAGPIIVALLGVLLQRVAPRFADPVERISLNVSSPVYGECGAVSINGSAELISGERRTTLQLTWDWGDGLVVQGYFPNNHSYSKNGQYSAKVTAYAGSNLTEGRTIPVNITTLNAKCK